MVCRPSLATWPRLVPVVAGARDSAHQRPHYAACPRVTRATARTRTPSPCAGRSSTPRPASPQIKVDSVTASSRCSVQWPVSRLRDDSFCYRLIFMFCKTLSSHKYKYVAERRRRTPILKRVN